MSIDHGKLLAMADRLDFIVQHGAFVDDELNVPMVILTQDEAKRLADELRALAQPAEAVEEVTLPEPAHAYITDDAVVVTGIPQHGWDEEGNSAHNCDSNGCGQAHVLYRLPFTDERTHDAAQGAVALRVPVPSDVLEARAQGRAEALAIILGEDPECFADDHTGSHSIGCTGDYGTHWDEDKLRALLRANDVAWSLLQEAEGEYWHNLGLREEAERIYSEATHPQAAPAQGDGVGLIAAERRRQVEAEGWTPEHDDEHGNDSLAFAAAAYSIPESHRGDPAYPRFWPWELRWWKPSPDNRVRELTKAGALIAAEIDRLQRAAAPSQEPQS